LEKILNEDEDANKLKELPKFPEFSQSCEQNIDEYTTKFQIEMKALNKEKKRHIVYCEQILLKAEREAEVDSITLIDKFKNYRKHRFRELARKDDEELYEKYEDDLLNQIEVLEDDLMGVEMKL